MNSLACAPLEATSTEAFSKPTTAAQPASGRRVLFPECDGLYNLLVGLRRRGQPGSQVATVLGSGVPEFLMPQTFVAVAVQTGPTRKLKRTSLRLYGVCASSTEAVHLSIPRATMPAQKTMPRWWEVRSVEFSRDGSMLALGYEDRRAGSSHLHLHCAESSEMMRRFRWPRASLMAAKFSPGDHSLAVGTWEYSENRHDSCVHIVQVRCFRSRMQTVTFRDQDLSGLSFAKGGRHVAAIVATWPGGSNGSFEVLLFCADSLAVAFRARISLDFYNQAFTTIAASPSTESLWVTGGGHRIYIMEASGPGRTRAVRSEGLCRNLECYPRSGLVAMSFFYVERLTDGVRLFDEGAGAFVASAHFACRVISMACDPRGQHLVVRCRHQHGTEGASLQVLDARSLASLQSLPMDGLVMAVALGISPSLAKAHGRSRNAPAPLA